MDVDSIKASKNKTKKEKQKEPEAMFTTEDSSIKTNPDHVLFSWKETDNQEKEKTKIFWVFFVLIIDALTITYLVWQKDWVPIPIVAALSAVLFWYKITIKKDSRECSIEKLGVRVGNSFYHYQELHSFWIVNGKDFKNLQLVFIKKYLPALSVDISNANVSSLRESLSKNIPEQEKRGESLIDKLVRILDL